jgi:hypothetical protein
LQKTKRGNPLPNAPPLLKPRKMNVITLLKLRKMKVIKIKKVSFKKIKAPLIQAENHETKRNGKMNLNTPKAND